MLVEFSKILFPNIVGLFTFLLADFFFKCDRGLCTSVEFLLYFVKTIVSCVHTDSLIGNAEIHWKRKGFLYLPWGIKFKGYIVITFSIRLFVCPFVRPSVCADSYLARDCFFLLWHCYTIFGTSVYHHETMCHVSLWSRYDIGLWLQVLFALTKPYFICHKCLSPWDDVSHTSMILIRSLPLISGSSIQVLSPCPTRDFCLLWYWLIIFGTLVYHHETMCRVHSNDVDVLRHG